MDISVKIGNEERALADAHPSWINQQINRRRDDGESVCVIVRIQTDRLNLILQTPTCGASGGGGRPPNADERRVLDLWDKHRLNRSDFKGGNLVAFLRQLESCS